MKTKTLLALIAFTIVLISTSCDNEDSTPKPYIEILELGDGDSHGNDHTANVGGELHIEAEIVAEGTIDKVTVTIHPEGEHEEHSNHEEWEYDSTYTEFEGKKNATFHKHVDVDTSAEAGNYHFHITVSDKLGYQTSAEEELLIIE